MNVEGKPIVFVNILPVEPSNANAPIAVIVCIVPKNVGLLLKTATPVPVSSDNTPASCAEVVEAN